MPNNKIHSRLDASQVAQIRELYDSRAYNQKQLSLMFSTSRPNVSLIVNSRTHNSSPSKSPHTKGARWWAGKTEALCEGCFRVVPIEEFDRSYFNGQESRRRRCRPCVNKAHLKYSRISVECKACGRPTRIRDADTCRACSTKQKRGERAAQKTINAQKLREHKTAHKKTLRDKWKLMAMEARGNRCARCGYEAEIPSVFDFHHRVPEEKIVSLAQCRTWKDFYAEAERCDMLCVVCHRITHWLMNHPEDIDKKGVIRGRSI